MCKEHNIDVLLAVGGKRQAWSCHPMEIARQSIRKLSEFFFDTLGLDDTFTKVGKISLCYQEKTQRKKGGCLNEV